MIAVRQTQTILDQIVERKHGRLFIERQSCPVDRLREQVAQAQSEGRLPPAVDFARRIRRENSIGIIAEIKKASPSRGVIQPDFRPAGQAAAYESAGVQAISVLTEEYYFQGSSHDLAAARAAAALPLLRKDFIIEPGQIYEARLLGASAILLIGALLDDEQLAASLTLAHTLGLAALVEIHDLPELMRALACGARLIGINNRDLRTFHIDLGTTERLAGLIPQDRTIVAESGIATPADLARVYRAGAHAALIGETLMRAGSSAAAVKSCLDTLFQEMPR
jgi:indole-3-glycerol phosphate synthase